MNFMESPTTRNYGIPEHTKSIKANTCMSYSGSCGPVSHCGNVIHMPYPSSIHLITIVTEIITDLINLVQVEYCTDPFDLQPPSVSMPQNKNNHGILFSNLAQKSQIHGSK